MLLFYLSLISDHENDDDFVKIYYKYRRSMYNIAKSYTHNHHDAEDVLQIAFIGIATHIDTIKKLDEEKLEIYVFKSAKNAALNILKSESSYKNKTFNLETQFNEPSTHEDIIEETIKTDLINEIFSFIDTMDEKYRDVLSLYFLHELNFREISSVLHTPISTIKDRFRKAHKLVIEKFKEYRK